MKRFVLMSVTLAAAIVLGRMPLGAEQGGAGAAQFDLVEATVPQIQQALQTRLISTAQLVQMYLARVAAYDAVGTATHLNSYLHVNANAVADAQQVDAARHAGRVNGPISGVPIC